MAISKLGTEAYLNQAGFATNTPTLPVTIPSGTELLVIMASINNDRWDQFTGLTLNGSAAGIVQQVTSPAAQANKSMRIWTVTNPTPGTFNLVWSFTTSSGNGGGYCAVCLSGVDTAAPVNATNVSSAGTATSPMATTITTLTGGWAMGGFFTSGGSPVRDPSQTVLGTDEANHSFSYKQDATDFKLTFTGSPQAVQAVIAVKPYAAPDTLAPTLTSATGAATGSSTATVGATTDEANGTMYAIASLSATPPSVAQIQAGQNAAGAAAPYAGNQTISSTGAKTFSATGLAASTTYYAHIQHKDAAGNDSTVVTSSAFTTSSGADTTPPTLTSPTGTATGSSTANGSVSTNEANGTLYRYASTNATETVATVKASGQTSSVSAIGVQTVSFTGLLPSTTYYAHYVHRDAAGNDSSRVSSASFATSAGGGGVGTFTSAVMTNDAETPLASVAVSWSWFLGAVGAGLSAPAASGTGTLSGGGVLTVSVPVGTGFMLIRNAAGAVVAYQEATVS